MAVMAGAVDILADEHKAKRDEIVGMLKIAYWMEMETVINYVTNSTNPAPANTTTPPTT